MTAKRRAAAVDILRRWVLAHGRAPGFRMPPLRPLAADLGLSRSTTHRALLDLEQQGLLTRSGPRSLVIANADTATTADLSGPTVLILLDRHLTAVPDDIVGNFGQEVVAGLLHGLRTHGCSPMMLRLGAAERLATTHLPPNPAAIVALLGVVHQAEVRRMLKERSRRRVPVIAQIDDLARQRSPADELGWDTVSVDHAGGRADLVHWLHARGRTRLLRIHPLGMGGRILPHWLAQQEIGHARACTDLGIPKLAPLLVPLLAEGLDPKTEDIHARLLVGYLYDRLSGDNAADALLAPTDALVIPLVRAVRLLGRDPRKLPIVGYDGYYWSYRWMRRWAATCDYEPPVSVGLPGRTCGEALAQLTVQRLRGELPPPAATPQRADARDVSAQTAVRCTLGKRWCGVCQRTTPFASTYTVKKLNPGGSSTRVELFIC